MFSLIWYISHSSSSSVTLSFTFTLIYMYRGERFRAGVCLSLHSFSFNLHFFVPSCFLSAFFLYPFPFAVASWSTLFNIVSTWRLSLSSCNTMPFYHFSLFLPFPHFLVYSIYIPLRISVCQSIINFHPFCCQMEPHLSVWFRTVMVFSVEVLWVVGICCLIGYYAFLHPDKENLGTSRNAASWRS